MIPVFVDIAFRELITEATLLINEGSVMQGLRIWGSSYTHLPGSFRARYIPRAGGVVLAWLINQVFAGGMVIHAIVGTDHLSYWRCVGLFAIWFTARFRIKFSGSAQIEIAGDC